MKTAKKSPLFLLGNDDGVHAPGINKMRDALLKAGRVITAAPHLEKSASSSAITIQLPILVQNLGHDVYGIEGTPADAMMVGLKKLSPHDPDWVISGINRGGNLGTDTIYSGTVGAAIEGCICGIPALAVSIEGTEPLKYETAAEVVMRILALPDIREKTLGSIINVNVPNVDFSELKGIRMAELGRRIYNDLVDERHDPRGKPYYWLGAGAKGYEPIAGSDCMLLDEGFATVTMLRPNLQNDALCTSLQTTIDSVI